MATSSTYCTHRDLKDVYPNIDDFDSKTPIYGWTASSGDLYVSYNSGLVTRLFKNGKDLGAEQATTPNENDEWWYDETNDAVYYYHTDENPIDDLMEGGDNFSTIITRITSNAIRLSCGRHKLVG